MITWQDNERQNGTGRLAFLGAWEVGWAGYGGMLERGVVNRYGATVALPGMRVRIKASATQAEAEERVERAVVVWVKRAGLRTKDG